jgi:large subunit ribosomal protein L23
MTLKQDPYLIVKSRYVTEKSRVLEALKEAKNNASLKKCDSPKYVFLVDKKANKFEIAAAVEEIYANKKIKVVKVNTILMKPKVRRLRGRPGLKPGYKKAVVTLRSGDAIDEN